MPVWTNFEGILKVGAKSFCREAGILWPVVAMNAIPPDGKRHDCR
jgi:hypothetical protein